MEERIVLAKTILVHMIMRNAYPFEAVHFDFYNRKSYLKCKIM